MAGKDNDVADFLSRRYEPGSAKICPIEIKDSHWTKVAVRDEKWWRTWSEPDGPKDGDHEFVSRI